MFIDLAVIGLCMMIILDVDGLEEWLLLALIYVGIIVITLFATWVATQFFDVDYYVAYQIMSFGQCLYSLSKNDD